MDSLKQWNKPEIKEMSKQELLEDFLRKTIEIAKDSGEPDEVVTALLDIQKLIESEKRNKD